MRVITGFARGKRLQTLEGEDVRPTTDKVKEGLFSAIQFEIEGRAVLDLFAGSGQLGIEALSRGAEKCLFVDKSSRAIGVVESNLKNTGLLEKARIINKDYASFLSATAEKFDIAFLDPPYKVGLLADALEKVAQKMNRGGVIVCESPKELSLPQTAGELGLFREYKYGRIKVSVYRFKEE